MQSERVKSVVKDALESIDDLQSQLDSIIGMLYRDMGSCSLLDSLSADAEAIGSVHSKLSTLLQNTTGVKNG